MKTGSRESASKKASWTGPLYLDASALVKIYMPEPGSAELDDALIGRDDLIISDLAITEVTSAMARRRRQGEVSPEELMRLHRAVLADVEAGVFRNVELLPQVYREAERMLISLESAALRAADSLHVALAIAAKVASIVTFDQRLAAAAERMGIHAVPQSIE